MDSEGTQMNEPKDKKNIEDYAQGFLSKRKEGGRVLTSLEDNKDL